jgi:hypothetical protein
MNFRGHLAYFRDRLFVLDREAPPAASEREEVVPRIKKAVYEEEAELSGLRAAVANMEARLNFKGRTAQGAIEFLKR